MANGRYININYPFKDSNKGFFLDLTSDDNSAINMINYMTSIGFQHINHPNTKDPTFINTKFLDKKDEIYIWQYY